MEKESIKVMARNREAYHEYFVEEEFEAGIELVGTEVKSIRAGTLNLKDAWCGMGVPEVEQEMKAQCAYAFSCIGELEEFLFVED